LTVSREILAAFKHFPVKLTEIHTSLTNISYNFRHFKFECLNERIKKLGQSLTEKPPQLQLFIGYSDTAFCKRSNKVKKAFRGKKNKIKPLDDTHDSGLSSSINNALSVLVSDCESNVRTGITVISREFESIRVDDTPCCDLARSYFVEYTNFLESLQELGGSLKTSIED